MISIGNNVTVLHGVEFIAHDECLQKSIHITKPELIRVEDDAFIGTSSIVFPNVVISEKAIIATGSVVYNSVPSREIWGGVPARKNCSLVELWEKNSVSEEIFNWQYIATSDISKHREVIEKIKRDGCAYIK